MHTRESSVTLSHCSRFMSVSQKKSAARRVMPLSLAWGLVSACGVSNVQYEPTTLAPVRSETPDAVLFLIGDVGDTNNQSRAVLADLSQRVRTAAGSTNFVTVAFLGDNIYEYGLTSDTASEEIARLEAQIAVLENAPTGVQGIFLPGNHDWAKGRKDEIGRARIELQAKYLRRRQSVDGVPVQLAPGDGCPGPEVQRLGRWATIVLIDTEPILRRAYEPCTIQTDEEFFSELANLLRQHTTRHVVLIAHHPLVSGGKHGGNIGGVEGLFRRAGLVLQDLGSSRYTDVRRKFYAAVASSGHPPLIYAAGHDHSLQVFRTHGSGTPLYQLVSGSGSKSTKVAFADSMLFATDRYGYIQLDLYQLEVDLSVYMLDGGRMTTAFSCTLVRPGRRARQRSSECQSAARIN